MVSSPHQPVFYHNWASLNSIVKSAVSPWVHSHKIKKTKSNLALVPSVNRTDRSSWTWKKCVRFDKQHRRTFTFLFSSDFVSKLSENFDSRKSWNCAARPNSSLERNSLARRSVRYVSTWRWNRNYSSDVNERLENNRFFVFQEVLGVYRNTYNISLNIQNNLPVFATIIEANYISTRDDKISFETLTDEDIQEIQRLAKDPKIAQRVRRTAKMNFSSTIDKTNVFVLSRFMPAWRRPSMVMKWLKKPLLLLCLVANQKIQVCSIRQVPQSMNNDYGV